MIVGAPVPPYVAAAHDQYSREDLLLLQRKALREWRDSDWLAAHDPRAYEAVMEQDPMFVRVDLGGGQGESQQEPGCIVVGEPGDRAALAASGERRVPDVGWMEPTRLPFEDATLDELEARRAPQALRPYLGAEITRVMRLGGRVRTSVALGEAFSAEDGGWYCCVSRGDPLAKVGPVLIQETVLGQPIRREREES